MPGVSATIGSPKFEAGAGENDTAQRIVYPVRITFESQEAFDAIPDDQDFRQFTFAAEMGPFHAVINLQLSKNPNPRMRDGDPPWLSIDLRVFKTNPGRSPTAGIAHPEPGNGAATDYITEVLEAYNSWPGANHPFNELPTDQEDNRLQLGINDENGDPAFNYAIARVRFRAPPGIDAVDVKVFFRMWTTGWTALEYDTARSYRRSGNGASAVPLLGLMDGEVNNIPCFAEPRTGNMESQSDPTNRRTLRGAGASEVFGYFGCWLDINDPTPRFPLMPEGNGPFDGDLLSVTDLVARGLHQCLVAEIHYDQDPTIEGAAPGQSDNLAQRNILLDDSDNPGGFAAHLVHHTFELKPSPVPLLSASASPDGSAASSTPRRHPDELVIDWGNLPRDSLVTLYMPQLDADAIARESGVRQRPATLSASGSGALRCRVTDIGFIPIPGPMAKSVAGLISIQLPPGVAYGSKYSIVLRQVAGRGFQIVGTTQLDIYVRAAGELRRRLEHNFSVLKSVSLAIPDDNRWRPVFDRYLGEMGERIRAFGGRPELIPASPYGTGGPVDRRPDGKPEPCHDQVACHDGKIVRVLFDCFGELEGFVLSDCCREVCFLSCDPGLERLVMLAWKQRCRVQVVTECAEIRVQPGARPGILDRVGRSPDAGSPDVRASRRSSGQSASANCEGVRERVIKLIFCSGPVRRGPDPGAG